MEEQNTTRKLRAIMFSDIVGYSKMMQNNEAESLKLLQKHKDIVTEISSKYGGKIIKHIGDEILVESESAVMLVYCAKELQKYFADRNATVPKSRELSVRIGIHIGDVIVKDDDIFGDGVNIASRIRPLARPGGIVITHSVLILLGNQDDIKCEFLGNKKLKNIKEKIKVYEVLTDSEAGPSIKRSGSKISLDIDTLLKVVLPVTGTALFIILMIFLFFFDHYTDYEEYYFRADYPSVRNITKDLRSEKNLKSNYYNIMSASAEEGGDILDYYSGMYSKDPENPKKAFYLALSYFRFHSDRNQLDSSYILLKKAEKKGLRSVFLSLFQLDLYARLDIKTVCSDAAEALAGSYPENPLVLQKCADVSFSVLNDPKKAAGLYRRSLSLYPEMLGAYDGLAAIELSSLAREKARTLSDSALLINPSSIAAVSTAIEVRKNMSDPAQARAIVQKLPDSSVRKYTESANIYLLEKDLSSALSSINAGLELFPNRTELVKMQRDIQKIIVLSDSIQQKEASLSRVKNKWYTSWEDAVSASVKEQKPIIAVALDAQQLKSKYIEHALLHPSVMRETGDIVLIKLDRYKDAMILKDMGIRTFPSIVWTDGSKDEIRSFKNLLGTVTDPGVIGSFIREASVLNKRLLSMIRETESNKVKNARNFSHAEEMALEYEMPVIAVLSDSRSDASKNYMKHTILNPAFIKNYRNMIFLSIEDAERSDVTKRFGIRTLPAVLFFDEDINLISVKYGVLPQKVLEKEIARVKLFRKRKDILKESVNWIYNTEEALSYSKDLSIPVLAYISGPDASGFVPAEPVFEEYRIIKKINSDYIPLFIRKGKEGYDKFFRDVPAGSIAVLNGYGDVIYDFFVPQDSEILSTELDGRTLTELYLGLGSSGFLNFKKDYETYRSLSDNRMRSSAENELLSFITEYPSFPYALIDLAELFLSKNDFSKSGHYLRFLEDRYFDLSEKFLKVMTSSYVLYDDIYRLNEFLELMLKKREKDPYTSSSINSALSEVNMAEGETIASISLAEKAYQQDPRRSGNLVLLGILNYSVSTNKAEQYFRSALVLDPSNLAANLYLYSMTGEKGYLTTARQSYHGGNADFTGLRYFDENKYFSRKGILELRERALRMKLSLYPDDPDFRLELAKFLTDSKSNLVEAMEIVNRLITESPNDPDFLSAAAWVSYNLGDFPGADRLITKALGNLSPEEYYQYPELFYNTGMIKSAIGDNRTAKYYFEMLLSFRNKNDIDHSKLDYAQRFIDSIQ